VSAWSAMVGHGTRRRQHAWRVSRGLAPLPALVPLPRWRGRVRSAGGAGALLAVLTPRPSRPLRCTRARALLRAEPPRDSLTACAALAEALLGRRRGPPARHPAVASHAGVLHGPPERMPCLVQRETHRIPRPLLTRSSPAPPQGRRRRVAPRAALRAAGGVRHAHPPGTPPRCDVARAARATAIAPDRVAHALAREARRLRPIGRCWGRHSSSTEGVNGMHRAHASPAELRGLRE
jgi:hypothetical protein